MIATDEDALICDFAETYTIYDYMRLPVEYAATLAVGLRSDSRIKLKLSKQRVSTDTLLSAAAVDALNLILWSKTKDVKTGRNKPKSLVEMLNPQQESEFAGFDSAAEFEKARALLINKG